jgi:hypothetical protein
MADEDYNRPYVGYRPVRRPEAQNDRIASANAPLSALRGYIAGTLGLPGNLEGLGRMLIPTAGAKPYLPNSEYFQKVLPLRSLQETPTGRVFTEVGDLFGGAGLATGAKVAGSGAKALGRATAEQIVKGVESGNPMFAAVAPMNVVKSKGGNWLAGAGPERFTGPVKKPVYGEMSDNPIDIANRAPVEAYNTWIDKKLGNYVRNEMATPEDPLRAMAEKWATEKPELLAQADAKLAGLNAKTQELAAQRGVPEEWLTSHRRDVLAAEKARNLIEAREALHTQGVAHGGGLWQPEYLARTRSEAGFPAEGMGVSKPAKEWEQITDESIRADSARTHLNRPVAPQLIASNPWLAKVPPETPIYAARPSNELGFEHLTDELRNALDPNSGLPTELLLKYADLPKKTVPDIVNRVADINAWRAAQKAEADLTKANNVAVVPFKEYPEQGLAWKEFKTPSELPEGWTQRPDALGVDTIYGPEGYSTMSGSIKDPRRAALRDALKYEGDTLQHCVGGANYCDKVQAGESKIYSLRDARGKPHATIEVTAGRLSGKNSLDEWKAAFAKTHGEEKVEPYLAEHPEIAEAFKPAINQIKGLKNGPPEKQYLPQIQDFIKSGNWSDVGDIDNAGMRRTRDVLNDLERKTLLERGYDFGDYMTTQERQGLQKLWDEGRASGSEGFAAGGYVEYDPDYVDTQVDRTRQGFAAGGAVNAGNEANLYDETKIQSLVDSLNKEMTNGY